jgi:hypothetical protein
MFSKYDPNAIKNKIIHKSYTIKKEVLEDDEITKDK